MPIHASFPWSPLPSPLRLLLPPSQPPLHSSDVTDMLFADWLRAWGRKSGRPRAWKGKVGEGSRKSGSRTSTLNHFTQLPPNWLVGRHTEDLANPRG